MREADLIKSLDKDKSIDVRIEALPIGDIIICDDSGVEKMIIERKTINDLLASIKDGRYDEQSCRLSGLPINNHNIVYLIEGSVSATHFNRALIFSSMFSLGYYKGFSVFRTMSVEESAFFLINTVQKMAREQAKGSGREAYVEGVTVEKEYISTLKKVKSENITPANINELMLSQIPGISAQSAKVIMEKFKTIPLLLESIRADEKCLDDVCYTNAKGDKRKINKTCLTNIRAFLLPDNVYNARNI